MAAVLAAYAAAFSIACALVYAYAALTAGPDRQTYGAMYGFGDSLLFLALFAIAAIPATGAALHFLKPHRAFWRALCVVTVAIGASGVTALVVYLAAKGASPASLVLAWSAWAVLRLLAAPIFALGFVLSGLFAPKPAFRMTLLVAGVVEAAVFVCIALVWLNPFQPR